MSNRILTALVIPALSVASFSGCASNQYQLPTTSSSTHAIKLVDRRPAANKAYKGDKVPGSKNVFQYGDSNFQSSPVAALEESMNKHLPFRHGEVILTKLDLTLEKADTETPPFVVVGAGAAGAAAGYLTYAAINAGNQAGSTLVCAFEVEFNGRHYTASAKTQIHSRHAQPNDWQTCMDEAVTKLGRKISESWLE